MRRTGHPATGFGSQTTGVSPNLGEGDLILLAYLGMEDSGCEPTSPEGNLMVVALDPRTGKEAWPALSLGEEARTFGGTAVNISPDRSTGYLSWDDDGTSALSRIDLKTGEHSTISLETARTVDDTGVDYYDVRPTTDPASALYVYGAEDPDDPLSAAVTRTAVLDLPAAPPQSTDPVMAVADTQGSGTQGAGAQTEATMEDIVEPVCAVEPAFTPQGEPTCLQPQLYASAIKYQGSTGGLKAWTADAPEAGLDSLGFPGAPQTAPVDGPDGPLVIVPGPQKSVDALDARTGRTVWSAGDVRTVSAPTAEDDAQFGMPWGGQGVPCPTSVSSSSPTPGRRASMKRRRAERSLRSRLPSSHLCPRAGGSCSSPTRTRRRCGSSSTGDQAPFARVGSSISWPDRQRLSRSATRAVEEPIEGLAQRPELLPRRRRAPPATLRRSSGG